MDDSSWTPLFRAPSPSITRVMQSQAFRRARVQSSAVMGSATELRELAAQVARLDLQAPPLSAVSDQVTAAVGFVRATAERLASDAMPDPYHPPQEAKAQAGSPASVAARERLTIATLLYLITPDDLLPDFRPGGYLDDVLVLAWVLGAAANELAPYMDVDSGAEAD